MQDETRAESVARQALQRAEHAEAAIETHEKVCAERWRQCNRQLETIEKMIGDNSKRLTEFSGRVLSATFTVGIGIIFGTVAYIFAKLLP